MRLRPRIRTIKPEIWQSPEVMALGLEARLFFVGLLTQADDEGRLPADPDLLLAQIYPRDQQVTHSDIEGWIERVCMPRGSRGERLVLLYEDDLGRPLLQIVKWHDHQRIDRPKPSILPPPPAECAIARAHTRRNTDVSSPSEGNGTRMTHRFDDASSNDRRTFIDVSTTPRDESRGIDAGSGSGSGKGSGSGAGPGPLRREGEGGYISSENSVLPPTVDTPPGDDPPDVPGYLRDIDDSPDSVAAARAALRADLRHRFEHLPPTQREYLIEATSAELVGQPAPALYGIYLEALAAENEEWLRQRAQETEP